MLVLTPAPVAMARAARSREMNVVARSRATTIMAPVVEFRAARSGRTVPPTDLNAVVREMVSPTVFVASGDRVVPLIPVVVVVLMAAPKMALPVARATIPVNPLLRRNRVRVTHPRRHPARVCNDSSLASRWPGIVFSANESQVPSLNCLAIAGF